MLREIILEMRPKQWTKNAFVFAGILFSLRFFNAYDLAIVAVAAFLFCLTSGSVYIINDLLDYEKDRHHPEKQHRPIASGRLPRHTAALAAMVIIGSTLLLSFALHRSFGFITLIYFLLNLAYSLYLKNQVIVDVLIIAVGFVLRAVAGAVVIDVDISEWLLLCTLLLALFLGLCKRRHELVLMESGASKHRLVLEEYTPELVDQMIAVVTASALMAYALYTISPTAMTKFHTTNLQFTIPFVLFGIFRYLYLVHRRNLGGSPEMILLRDVPMIVDLAMWVITVIIVLYHSAAVQPGSF